MGIEEEAAYPASVMADIEQICQRPVADLQMHACTDMTGFGLAGHA